MIQQANPSTEPEAHSTLRFIGKAREIQGGCIPEGVDTEMGGGDTGEFLFGGKEGRGEGGEGGSC